MKFKSIDRRNSYAMKLDDAEKKFGSSDLLPLWVADMDLASPLCVQETLQERAKHPLYGYTVYPEKYYALISAWMGKRFGFSVEKEWIVPCYGVVPSINLAIEAYTNKGEGVVIQSPIYPPFASSVLRRERILNDNVLVYDNGQYKINFEDFEEKIKLSKLFLLCSPHNPSGRVWDTWELEKMIAICKKHKVIIVSDEIHADIVYKKKHIVLSKFEEAKDISVILNAPSKTFNIAGLNTSYAIIPNDELRKKFNFEQDKTGVTNGTPFGIEALMSAYESGAEWLDELKPYLESNIEYVASFLEDNNMPIKAVRSEATFLVWLDCRGLALSHDEIVEFFIKKAKLGLNDGVSFGKAGEGFMRLNVGTSKEILETAMGQLYEAYRKMK